MTPEELFQNSAILPAPYWVNLTEMECLRWSVRHHSLNSDGSPRLVLDEGALERLSYVQLDLLRINLAWDRNTIRPDHRLWT